MGGSEAGIVLETGERLAIETVTSIKAKWKAENEYVAECGGNVLFCSNAHAVKSS